jgi:hypothetical protein
MMTAATLQAVVLSPKAMVDYPLQHMGESGQGPKRAIAEAVAHLLKIQPGIHNNTVESSSKRPVARV